MGESREVWQRRIGMFDDHLIVSGPNRLLHVHVAPDGWSRAHESLGHELQHVLEVLGSSARSTAEMYNFFEYGPGVYRVGDRFETVQLWKQDRSWQGSRAGAVAASAVQVFTRLCRLRHRRRQRQWQQAGCRQVAIIAVLGPLHQCSRPVGRSSARKWPPLCRGSEPMMRTSHELLLKPLNGLRRFGVWSRRSSGPMEWCGYAEDRVTVRSHAC